MTSRFDRDGMLRAAEQATGLSDWGDLPFLPALDMLLGSIEEEGRLPEGRRPAVEAQVTGTLVKRLSVVNDRRTHPQIAAEDVGSPLVVLGLPRTGTTHLHALLAADPAARAPLTWELSRPSPPPDRATFALDPRIAQVQAELDARPDAAEMMKKHPASATRPEQCTGLLDVTFLNWAILAQFHVPTFFAWMLNADHRPAYEMHRRMLQHLQWRNPGRWVLKHPKHMLALDALLATYPSARIVWTHRDPGVLVPSVLSLVSPIRRANVEGFDAAKLAVEWAALEEIGLLRGLAFRDRLLPASHVHDVQYNDLMADPLGTVRGIYDHFGMAFSDEAAASVAQWVAEHPQDKHGVHTYRAQDFGLDPDALRERFRSYIERFGVERDRR